MALRDNPCLPLHNEDMDGSHGRRHSHDDEPHYFDPTRITTSLPLLPFHNQVGGHASFFRFSKRAICKPVSQKEQAFYEHLEAHPQLLPFTPQYLGVLNVTYRTRFDSDASVHTPLLPEVVFEKNKHLLRDWRSYYEGSLQKRRASVATPAPYRRTKRFQEQVLREVFSPQALKDRLQQVHDWQRQKKHAEYGASPRLHHRSPHANDPLPQPTHGRGKHRRTPSGPLSTCFSETTSHSLPTAMSSSSMGSPRQPSVTDTAISAPLTPTMYDAKQHDERLFQGEPDVPQDDKQDWAIEPHDSQPHVFAHDGPDEIFDMEDVTPQDHSNPDGWPDNAPASTVPLLQPNSPDLPAAWQSRQTPDNPWSLHVYHRDLQKAKSCATHKGMDALVKQYLLIEDLTDGVKYPCVLDLKMGTRQYGVYATPAKMKSQTLKCEQSTSKQLGVRVCGIQVYKTDTGTFVFHDKYYGRRLDPLSFWATLAEYLDNGSTCLIHHIPTLLIKLRRLASLIRSLDGYRFYASSLLMIYDGDPTSQRSIDVRIIDFAHCVTKEDVCQHGRALTYPPRHPGPDAGYLLGLQTLISCFEEIYEAYGGNPAALPVDDDAAFQNTHGTVDEPAFASY